MTTGAVEHSRAMSPAGGGGQNRHQPAQEVAVQPDIPGADAVADQRRSQLRDALSVGTLAVKVEMLALIRGCVDRPTQLDRIDIAEEEDGAYHPAEFAKGEVQPVLAAVSGKTA